jgi:hypothetical protein
MPTFFSLQMIPVFWSLEENNSDLKQKDTGTLPLIVKWFTAKKLL